MSNSIDDVDHVDAVNTPAAYPEAEPYSRAWAKLSDGKLLPLEDHAADVASMMQALLELGWLCRLEAIQNRSFSKCEHDTLLALSFLHDIGKCNRGFWGRQFAKAPIVGHTSIVLSLYDLDDIHPELEALGDLIDSAGQDLFCATLAHHGAPVVELPRGGRDKIWWKASERYDPLNELDHLVRDASERFPAAFGSCESAVSLSPRTVSLYAGLLTLADWLGSDIQAFPIDGVTGTRRAQRSLKVARQRVLDLGLGTFAHSSPNPTPLTFQQSFNVDTPFETQRLCGENCFDSLLILEAETGSGKTEAALWRFLNLFAEGKVDGLYFALPTRTSAVQMHARVQRCLDLTFGKKAPQAVLAVPGYLRAGHTEGKAMGRFDTLWPDDLNDHVEDATWSAEAPKRFLSARVAIGTVDQAMLSGLRTRHAHLRAATLSRSLLVVDEVHASDPYMTEVLARVIENHRPARFIQHYTTPMEVFTRLARMSVTKASLSLCPLVLTIPSRLPQ